MSAFSDIPSLVAGGDISPYRFVQVTGRNIGSAISSITQIAVGVTDGSTKSFDSALSASVGDPVNLQGGSVVLVEAAAAISAGARVAPSANGRAQTAVATQYPFGIALEPAGAGGQIIRVYKQPVTAIA
jgi:hypothetical protein